MRFIPSLHISMLLLRLAFGITYIWFGALKIFAISPIEPLIRASYSFVPFEPFQLFIGFLEVIIGLGLLIGKKLTFFILLLWVQMGGVFTSVLLAPQRFFHEGNVLALSLEGEFMLKNLILLAGSLILLAHAHHIQNKS